MKTEKVEHHGGQHESASSPGEFKGKKGIFLTREFKGFKGKGRLLTPKFLKTL